MSGNKKESWVPLPSKEDMEEESRRVTVPGVNRGAEWNYERVYHPWCFKLDFDVAKFKAGLFPAVSISQLWYPRCIESYFDS